MGIKPVLLVNCLITDDVLSIYDRGQLCSHSKFDVFKYMLKSISVLEYDRVYINFSLSDAYVSRQNELLSFVKENFPDASVRNRRLERYGEWIDFIETNEILAGPPILLMCNDDHIFLSENKDYFKRLLEGYSGLLATSPLVSLVYSHWQESRRFHAALSIIQTGADFDLSLADNSHDGIQMLSPELMRRWFYEESAQLSPDTLVRRSEDLGAAQGVAFRMLPKKELFRHFDGYSSSGIGIKECSPLTIPVGFFEKQMRICFANLVSKAEAQLLIDQGFTICSPATALVGGLTLSQPIYGYTPETLPLAWVQQITEVANYGTYNEKLGRSCHSKLALNRDFNRPQKYSVSLDKGGDFEVRELPKDSALHPYLGFHKTPTRNSKRCVILLQDVRFYKKDQHASAIENAAALLASEGISVHIALLYSSNVLFQGRMFAVLNNLLGSSHQHVDSVVSLNCSENLRSGDLAHFIDGTYEDVDFCVCHNADPVKGLPIMVDVLRNNEKYFPADHGTVSFIAAGIPNAFGASTNMLIANSRQFKIACRSDRQMGPDVIESLLNQMEDEQMGIHSAKILQRA